MNSSLPSPPQGRLQFAQTRSEMDALSKKAAAGSALRITPRIFVVDSTLPVQEVVRLHQNEIVGHIWPKSVYCGVSALTAGAPKDGLVFIAHPAPPRKTKLTLPGMTIEPVVGPDFLPGDIALPGGAATSGNARKLVENVHLVGKPKIHRAGSEVVENTIDDLVRRGGAAEIRKTLETLDVIANHFDANAVKFVRSRLAALLGTNSPNLAGSTGRLASRLSGQPFDAYRIDLLEKITENLGNHAPSPRVAPDPNSQGLWEPFYESYFSNFIEGTEFGIEEARAIVIDGKINHARPQDSHDVSATFSLASDANDRVRVPQTGLELMDLLEKRHLVLMAARQDKNPGVFKTVANRAGNTLFVDPELVEGTLVRGFEVINKLTDPFTRAIAVMALVTECHPFDDGNGRVARLTANAELSVAGQSRFIIPTSYRNDYVAALSAFSNDAGAGQSLLTVMDFAQKWTSSIDWSDFELARKTLEGCNAFVDPGVAELNGQRLKMAGR